MATSPTNAAMVYAKEAKAAGSNPRALADELAEALRDEPDVAKRRGRRSRASSISG